MKMIKNLFYTLVVLAGLTFSASAAQTTITIAPNTFTNILVGAGRIQQFVLTSTTATSNTLAFVDSPTNSQAYVLSGYSNVVLTVGLVTNIYTNYFGVLTTNTYTGQTSAMGSVLASTNSYNGILTAQVTGNSTLTIGNAITFPNGSTYYFYQGVGVTNSGAGSVIATITYQQ